MTEINTNEVFKTIKKHRGERFAKILREAALLDVPNIEHILEFTKLEDLQKLIPAIRFQCKIKSVSQYETDKTPLQLLDEAGYDAFVVKTEEQKNSIQKYYRPGEEICTLRDPHRHKNFYIIHAVKRGADKIKPSNTPNREDEYGTSVISIQIAKGGGFISIKNRYNHTVNNPDATFGNNPDNIIPGLTNSLRKFFNVEFNVSYTEMPDHYAWVNDQLVWYSFEKDNVYFGDNYYFTGGTITRLNTDYETMLDYMIYNAKDKTVSTPIGDDFCTLSIFREAFNGKKVEKTFDKKKNETTLNTLDGNRIIVSGGQIIELSLPNVEKIGDFFLDHNQGLTSINLPNVKSIGKYFLEQNRVLKSIELQNVESIGDRFLCYNQGLTSINLPNVKNIGDEFLCFNQGLTSINLPNVKNIGDDFLCHNQGLTSINLPNVKEIGDYFLESNQGLTSINLPNVENIGYWFLFKNQGLTSINLPQKYDWLAKRLLAQNNSKIQKLKNAINKVIKGITKKTQNKNVPDNSR